MADRMETPGEVADGIAGGEAVGASFSQAEIELAQAVVKLLPLSSEPHEPSLVYLALPLLREAKLRMRLGHRVDSRAIAIWIEDDPLAFRSLSRLDQTQVDFIFSIVLLAIELRSIPERN